MKVLRVFSMLVSFFLLLFFNLAAASSADIMNRVVAQVNDDVITLYELDSKIKQITGKEPTELKEQNKDIYLEARRKVLDLLIDEKIAHAKIEELGIRVPAEEVDAAIERIKKENGMTQEDLIARLKTEGLDYERYKQNVQVAIERNELINFEVKSKVVVNEEKIAEYYKQHESDYGSGEEVHLAAIFLKSDKGNKAHSAAGQAQEVLVRLKKGEDFGELARQLSQGPGAAEGGDLGFFETENLAPELRTAVESMSPGDVSAPIPGPAGVQIIKLLEKKEKRVKALDEVRDSIYAILYNEEIEKRYANWIKELREKAYTKIIF